MCPSLVLVSQLPYFSTQSAMILDMYYHASLNSLRCVFICVVGEVGVDVGVRVCWLISCFNLARVYVEILG